MLPIARDQLLLFAVVIAKCNGVRCDLERAAFTRFFRFTNTRRDVQRVFLKRTGWSSLCNSIHRHRSHSVVQSIKEVKGDRSTLRHRETSSIASSMHCNAMDPKNGVQNVALRDQRRAWDAILLRRLLK